MNLLKERILRDGIVTDDNVLQVGSFLNHMIDTQLLYEIGKEFAAIFKCYNPTKIITIEASGIPIAAFCALELQIPFIIAKKYSSSNISNEVYSAKVFSYTKNDFFDVRISKKYISKSDKILIVDDFLAHGNAVEGLIHIIKEAEAKLIGVGICIEKSFQDGASKLIAEGVNLHSLVKITTMGNGAITIDT